LLTTNKTIEPNPVDYYIPGYVNISQLQLRSEKFDNNARNNSKVRKLQSYQDFYV